MNAPPRILDFNSEPKEDHLGKFFSNMSNYYQEKQDQDTLGQLTSKYKENRDNEHALEDLGIDIENSNMGPKKRIEALNRHKEMTDHNLKQKQVLATQGKAAQDKIEKQRTEERRQKEGEEKADALIKKEELKADALIKKEDRKKAETQSDVEEFLLNNDMEPEEAKRKSKFLSQSSAYALVREKNERSKVSEKDLKKQKEEDASKDTAQRALNEIIKLIPEVGIGSGVMSAFGGETAKSTGKFKALTGALEAELVDRVSRGTLSNTRFEYIVNELLPKSGDSQNTIRGKIEGLAVTLDLDASLLEKLTGKGGKKEKKQERKAPEGKVLVKTKGSNEKGFVTPYDGMESKYDIINE